MFNAKMFNTLTVAASFLKVHSKGKLGNPIILLSCQATSLLFFVGCVVITSQQTFGEPIQCVQDNGEGSRVPEKTLNLFCFSSGTFGRVQTSENGKILDFQANEKKHSYYPWVPLLCLLQGLLFMIPQGIGTIKENSRLEKFIVDSHSLAGQDFPSMARYLSKLLNSFGGWVLSCVFSEVVYCFIVLGNFYAVDLFFGGSFLDYGYKALFHKEFQEDTVFPKQTRCTFFKYGPTGDIQNVDALCLMPLNMINEKLYILFWYWLVVLIGMSFFIIIRRIIYLISILIRHKNPIFIKTTLAPGVSWSGFTVLNTKLSMSDWMLLEQIRPHLDPWLYTNLLENVAKEISEPHDLILSRENDDFL